MLRFLKKDEVDTAQDESKAGLFSSGGAVMAAILASACCWLPLAVVGTGASAVGAAGFFESYRPHFLTLTLGLLGIAFYFVYVRKPKCAPGEACAVPNPKMQRLNKIALWVATVMTLAFAAFPSYGSLLSGGDGEGAAAKAVASEPEAIERIYTIKGMTCESCTAKVRSALSAIPGVKAVEVSYSEGTAKLVFEAGTVDDFAVAAALKAIGYTGTPR